MNVPELPALLSAQMAVYRGRDLVEYSVARTTVNVVDDGGDFPDAIDRGEAGVPTVAWVQLPKTVLTRRYRRSVTAEWDGEHIAIVARNADVAYFRFNGAQEWALKHALPGSRYDGGWTGEAPVAELSNIQIHQDDGP